MFTMHPIFTGTIILFDECLMWDNYFILTLGFTTFIAILLTFNLLRYFELVAMTAASLKRCLGLIPGFGGIYFIIMLGFAGLGFLNYQDKSHTFR